ncbi:MAG: Na/Pi symporter, partial [Clostridia bacterium]|nr:Na/Pi symporter [Clostridia bacterium]
MSIFDIISLLGGLSLFLYGMRTMSSKLKEESSGTLKRILGKVTDNPVKAFLLGVAVTALIQSSTATIVITSGLVAAGLIEFRQSIGIIMGANVGTTVTGQIIRLLDIDSSSASWLRIFKPSTLAPVSLIIGIVLIMFLKLKNSEKIGGIFMGFGMLFTGLMNMTSSVSSLSESGMFEKLFAGLGRNPLIGYATGAGVATLLQSSSATIGI